MRTEKFPQPLHTRSRPPSCLGTSSFALRKRLIDVRGRNLNINSAVIAACGDDACAQQRYNEEAPVDNAPKPRSHCSLLAEVTRVTASQLLRDQRAHAGFLTAVANRIQRRSVNSFGISDADPFGVSASSPRRSSDFSEIRPKRSALALTTFRLKCKRGTCRNAT